MFFTYRQNNSGGNFTENRSVAVTVIIEAGSAELADAKAESIGIYFDGCKTGDDCACCGDRWSRAYGDGTEAPTVYGKPPKTYSGYDTSMIIYYLDRVERFRAVNGKYELIP